MPVVFTLPPSIVVVPAESVVRLTSGVVPPTAAENRVVPAALAISRKPPSTVPEKVVWPLPVETPVSAFRSVVPKVATALLVWIVPARFVVVGVVLVIPLVNVATSPASSPIVVVPVLAKVAAAVTATLEPVSSTS